VGQGRQIEHVDDALVADDVDRLRLGEEPLDEIAAIAALAGQHLDRDAAAALRVHALVHAPHAAHAAQARAPTRADRRAEQQIVTDVLERATVGGARAGHRLRRTTVGAHEHAPESNTRSSECRLPASGARTRRATKLAECLAPSLAHRLLFARAWRRTTV